MRRFRTSILQLDRNSVLPLVYSYDPEETLFRTMGFVRTPRIMVAEGVSHVGADTPGERDRFLLKVLTSLLIPPDEAHRIVVAAAHSTDPDFETKDIRPQSNSTELGGLHIVVPGLIVGVVCGILVGYLLSGWNGVAIGAFVGSATFSDLFMAGWQLAHARSAKNYVEIHDTVAILLIGVGQGAGALLGYALGGDTGLGQGLGVFAGMATAVFGLSLLATTFSMVPFRNRTMIWLGPLIIGGTTWIAYSMWNSPIALALGVVAGSFIARSVAVRVFPLVE